MGPNYHLTGYQTFDLTECKIHRIVGSDGKPRFIAFFPKKWTVGDTIEMQTVTKGVISMKPYTVTEWEEVELEPKHG